ncbi:hypothetical protein EXIGLDRAFT_726209 [Exidia glandulosa HHB12029]|uniref:Diels-Alderase C-terminal domain-containing protein n=1 Tax=Exidia glandulosa HHB12029 TaxID=1314781 RepID=A0A165MDU6_EXIGL|nr:hypothetical protein EXIGLDRAFT_726209 [Exidia glandulosa HHB12029]
MSSATSYYADAPYFALPTTASPDLPNQIWYFEAVADQSSSKASLQVVFWSGQPVVSAPIPFYVTVSGTYADGSYLSAFYPATSANVSEGRGVWDGAASWEKDEHGWFIVTFPAGRLRLKSVVDSGHYPTADEDAHIQPGKLPMPLLVNGGIGWSTTVPAAVVEVDATFEGKALKFHGTGFHDTNFATTQWPQQFTKWFWVRGNAGPYTFVVYHFLPRGNAEGKWHTSAALWRDGKKVMDTWTGARNSAEQTVQLTPSKTWPATPADIGDAQVDLTLDFHDSHTGLHRKFTVTR